MSFDPEFAPGRAARCGELRNRDTRRLLTQKTQKIGREEGANEVGLMTFWDALAVGMVLAVVAAILILEFAERNKSAK